MESEVIGDGWGCAGEAYHDKPPVYTPDQDQLDSISFADCLCQRAKSDITICGLPVPEGRTHPITYCCAPGT